MKYSEEIAQAIKTHLEDKHMHLVAMDEDGVFGFVMHLNSCLTFVHFVIYVHKDCFTVNAICPVSADTDDSAMMNALSEFVNRANFGLKSGNFEMDFRDGEIRYKYHVDCKDQAPSDETIGKSIGIPISMYKRYSPGILGVLFQNMPPKEAIELCENDEDLIRREFAKLVGLADSLDDVPDLASVLKKRLESLSESDEDDDEESEEEGDDSECSMSFEEFEAMLSANDALDMNDDEIPE